MHFVFEDITNLLKIPEDIGVKMYAVDSLDHLLSSHHQITTY